MKNIEIEKKGIILNGEYKNWYIFIQNLDQEDGAYLILLNSPDGVKGFDDWVANMQSLECYFREAKWNIRWLNEEKK